MTRIPSIVTWVLSCLFSLSPVLAAEYSTAISLERSVHFLAPNGDDLLIEPGVYSVEQAQEWIRLIPDERRNAHLIQATSTEHSEKDLQNPVALSVTGSEEDRDQHHIVLMFPNGSGLDALGSYSGVRARGLSNRKLTPLRLQQAFIARRPVVSLKKLHRPTLRNQKPSRGSTTPGQVRVPPPRQQSSGKQVPSPPILMNPAANFKIPGTSAVPEKFFTWRPPRSGPSISHYMFKLEDADNPAGHRLGPVRVNATRNTVATKQIISPRYRGKRIRWSVQTCSHNGMCSSPASRIIVWVSGLPAPVLQSPAPGAIATTLRPRLQWREVRQATYYMLCVSRPGVACPTRETPAGTNRNSVVVRRTGSSANFGAPNLTQFFGQQVNWTVSACTSNGECTMQRNVRPLKVVQAPEITGSGRGTIRPNQALEWKPNSDAPQFKLCVFTGRTSCASSGNLIERDVTNTNGRFPTDIAFLNQLPSHKGKILSWQVAACIPNRCLWSKKSSFKIPQSVWNLHFKVLFIDVFHDCDDASPGDLKFSFRASISLVGGSPASPNSWARGFDFGNYNNIESGTQVYVNRGLASIKNAIPGDKVEFWGNAYDCDRASCGEEVVELLTTGRDDKLGEIPRRKWESSMIRNNVDVGWLSEEHMNIDSRDTSCYGLAQGLRGTERHRFDTTFRVGYEVDKTRVW